MADQFNKLPLVIDGKTIITPCVEIMALSKAPKAEGAEGYVRFYEAFARRYAKDLTGYQLNDSSKWKRVLSKDLAKVPSWFSDARSLRAPLLGITMHTHEPMDEPQPPLFDMMFEHVYPAYPRGMFRIALPLDVLTRGSAELLALVDDAMAELPVHWGTAGFAFYWRDTSTTVERYAEQWLGGHLARHPGLSTGRLLTWGSMVEWGVGDIGWLTFVGDALIDELGGREALEARLAGTGVGLRTYGKGVALQAGDAPELGDVNRKNTLPLCHEVGRVLAPVFAPDDFLEKVRVTGIKDPDARLAWLRRFLP